MAKLRPPLARVLTRQCCRQPPATAEACNDSSATTAVARHGHRTPWPPPATSTACHGHCPPQPPSTRASAHLGCRSPREKHPPPGTAAAFPPGCGPGAAGRPAAQYGHRPTRSLNARHGCHPGATAHPSLRPHARHESPAALPRLRQLAPRRCAAVRGRAAAHLLPRLPMRPPFQCGLPVTRSVQWCPPARSTAVGPGGVRPRTRRPSGRGRCLGRCSQAPTPREVGRQLGRRGVS